MMDSLIDEKPTKLHGDEYLSIASHIFQSCNAKSNTLLPVNTLMGVIEPFVDCNKTEYTCLYSLLDPENKNPGVSMKKLASALREYGNEHNNKVSGNWTEQNMLHSNITLEGQSEAYNDTVLELEMQLQEKAHIIQKMKQDMEFADRQHEETLGALAAERDTLRSHLQILRDENTSLSYVKKDYNEISEWSHAMEEKLNAKNLELEMLRKRTRSLQDIVEQLQTEKQTLTEGVNKCKEDYNRMNEAFTARQLVLLEDKEILKSELTDLQTKYSKQEKYLEHVLNEKLLVEMELKDILNKSNSLDHIKSNLSVDISYTDASILRTLDTLNSESDYHEHLSRIEDTSQKFIGRPSNISLYDELKEIDGDDDMFTQSFISQCQKCASKVFNSTVNVEVQTQEPATELDKNTLAVNPHFIKADHNVYESSNTDNNNVLCEVCQHCDEKNCHITQLENDLALANQIVNKMNKEIVGYEDNLLVFNKIINALDTKNDSLSKVIESLQVKLDVLDKTIELRHNFVLQMKTSINEEKSQVPVQTESTQTEQRGDNVSDVSVQCEEPCFKCSQNQDEAKPCRNSLLQYGLNKVKSLLQWFAIICLALAIMQLYGVMHYHFSARRCVRPSSSIPWMWMSVDDIISFIFRIDYVGKVPM